VFVGQILPLPFSGHRNIGWLIRRPHGVPYQVGVHVFPLKPDSTLSDNEGLQADLHVATPYKAFATSQKLGNLFNRQHIFHVHDLQLVPSSRTS